MFLKTKSKGKGLGKTFHIMWDIQVSPLGLWIVFGTKARHVIPR
jgi:hypothetical protein